MVKLAVSALNELPPGLDEHYYLEEKSTMLRCASDSAVRAWVGGGRGLEVPQFLWSCLFEWGWCRRISMHQKWKIPYQSRSS